MVELGRGFGSTGLFTKRVVTQERKYTTRKTFDMTTDSRGLRVYDGIVPVHGLPPKLFTSIDNP